MKKIQAYFYLLNTTDIQHYVGLIIESAKKDIVCNIKIFDNTHKKRCFYYYSEKEFKEFFEKIFHKNNLNLSNLKIKKYGINDKHIFLKDYSENVPNVIFTRSTKKLKYPVWLPKIEKDKTVLFYWKGHEAFDKDNDKNLLNVLLYTGKAGFPLAHECNAIYPGLLRYRSKSHKPVLTDDIQNFLKNDKTCFIVETWPRGNNDKNSNWKTISETIKSLKKLGYSIAWKTREKGYPAQSFKENNYTDRLDASVELIIEKDLNYPSSLYHLAKNCDITINFNVTTTISDSINLSPNPFVIFTESLSKRYRDKVRYEWGEEYKNLGKYVNFYDEKNNNMSILDFIAQKESVVRGNKDQYSNCSRDLIKTVLELINNKGNRIK